MRFLLPSAGAAAAALAAAVTAAAALPVPASPRGDTAEVYASTAGPVTVADPYRWLEDLDAPPTRAWVEAQNARSLPFLAALPERAAFARRLATLWSHERTDTPTKVGARYFYTLNNGLQNQAVLMVRDGTDAARVLLDPNALAADGTVALAGYRPSPDGRHLQYATAAAGSDWNEFRIRDVATGKDLPEVLTRIKFSEAAWTQDSAGFFYSRYPAPARRDATANEQVFDELAHQKVYYHRLGTPQSEDRLVFEWPAEPRWFVQAELTPDGRWLFLTLRPGAGDRCRVLLLDLQDAQAPRFDARPRLLVDNFDHAWKLVGSQGRTLFLQTSRDAPRERVIAVDLDEPDLARARVVIPESADTLQSVEQAGGRLVALTLRDAASRLTTWSYEGRRLAEIALPGLGSIPDDSLHGAVDDDELLIGYQSYNRPLSAWRVALGSARARPFAPLRLAFDPASIVTERMFYPSADGTRIPLFISYRKGARRDGKARVFLHGYGGFNIAKTPAFDASALAWMERGGYYAVACLRGGGEYGEAWHLAGTRERKQNVFDDFAAAARYLVAERYTSFARIAIWGRSNGGLLVGASVNQHPELWGAAVATVGVMDMLRFQRFTVGYAWTGDYGSSDDPAGFDVLRRYSPLHTTVAGTRYPPTLVTTGDHDDRVHPAHSYKYTAALQAAQAGAAPVLIRIDTRAGHGAGKPVAKIIDEEADKLAFMWHYTDGRTVAGPAPAKPAAEQADAQPPRQAGAAQGRGTGAGTAAEAGAASAAGQPASATDPAS